MTHYSRKEIGLREPEGKYLLVPSEVRGIALHWPGHTVPLRTPETVMRSLRAWQAYHMDDREWSDIAYQVAIDQGGNTYRLRGLRYRSAANGSTSTNHQYGALLLVVAQGEKPTDQLIAAVRRRIARHRDIFPKSRGIVGHREIRPDPTDCPGSAIQRLIDDGRFTPPPRK